MFEFFSQDEYTYVLLMHNKTKIFKRKKSHLRKNWPISLKNIEAKILNENY